MADATLPPGQRVIGGFPRFGTHLWRPAPSVPVQPVIEIRGAVPEPFDVPLTELASLPRRELVADFHCVAGWSAADLRWEGVPFATLYRSLVEPALRPGTSVTHLVCSGLDGYRSVLMIEDALADDVLIAEHLDGRPLDTDHGAPVRLVSPQQYGHLSTKHLSRIEVCTREPRGTQRVHGSLLRQLPMRLLNPHPRARVRHEERHRLLPAWAVRRTYRALIGPFAWLSARGGQDRGPS